MMALQLVRPVPTLWEVRALSVYHMHVDLHGLHPTHTLAGDTCMR